MEELALIIGEQCALESRLASKPHSDSSRSFSDGKSLSFALEKDLSPLFLELAVMCKAVVCCESRMTLADYPNPR